ncbi:MAG: MBL fold metallo-hydrolase [Chloroflexi bacterium]|nr:MBL fold metallo-hydrolase [Chloroflexota bacterium]MCC6894094.1 MBL fold metallo-hydrolase [Anaerolineae bacterium]
MQIKWYGHASFLVTGENGKRVITDPYTPETSGYNRIPDSPDIVIISSDNDTFHCRADLVPGTPTIVNALQVAKSGGQRTEHGIAIQAIAAMEALDHQFHDPDQNGMYRFTVDDISIGHMGDIGNAFTEEQLQFFSGVDVLFALVGGHPTINLDDLEVVIKRTQPKLVIPMHFRTLKYKPRNSFWIQSFLNYYRPEEVDFACDSEITLTKASLPQSTRVMVLTHAC